MRSRSPALGERAHLLSSLITLETHIADVMDAIEAEELQDVVLAVHSYAGMLGTAVADRMPQRLRHLVYVDAVVPQARRELEQHACQRHARGAAGGRAGLARLQLPGAGPGRLRAGRRGPRMGQAPPDAAPGPHLPGAAGVRSASAWPRVPRTFVDCVQPALGTIDAIRPRVRDPKFWDGAWQAAAAAGGGAAHRARPDGQRAGRADRASCWTLRLTCGAARTSRQGQNPTMHANDVPDMAGSACRRSGRRWWPRRRRAVPGQRGRDAAPASTFVLLDGSKQDHRRPQGQGDAGELLGHQLHHLRGRDAQDRRHLRQVQGQGLRHAGRGHELRPAQLRGELRADAQAALQGGHRQHRRGGQGLGRRAADAHHLRGEQAAARS